MMDLEKRIKEIKDRLIEEDKARQMEHPIAQVADTVLYLHAEDEEFLKRVKIRVLTEIGKEKANEWFSDYKKNTEIEKNKLVPQIYLTATMDFIKKIVGDSIIKEDHYIVYNNIIRFFKGLTQEK